MTRSGPLGGRAWWILNLCIEIGGDNLLGYRRLDSRHRDVALFTPRIEGRVNVFTASDEAIFALFEPGSQERRCLTRTTYTKLGSSCSSTQNSWAAMSKTCLEVSARERCSDEALRAIECVASYVSVSPAHLSLRSPQLDKLKQQRKYSKKSLSTPVNPL